MAIFPSHLTRRFLPYPLVVFFPKALVLLFRSLVTADKRQPLIEFRPGDRIAIIGNTLAERMQHDGWLETLLLRRLPKHQLVFRNLAFPGDELTLWLRSANSCSPAAQCGP